MFIFDIYTTSVSTRTIRRLLTWAPVQGLTLQVNGRLTLKDIKQTSLITWTAPCCALTHASQIRASVTRRLFTYDIPSGLVAYAAQRRQPSKSAEASGRGLELTSGRPAMRPSALVRHEKAKSGNPSKAAPPHNQDFSVSAVAE